MINFTDVVPVDSDKKYAHSITERSDGLFDVLYEPGVLTETPTEYSRDTMMRLQGFDNFEIDFNTNGSIVETTEDGVFTTLLGNGVIAKETFVANNGQQITITTEETASGGLKGVVG